MSQGKERSRTVDEYIRAFPKDVQVILERVRQAIRDAAPGAEETTSYGMPAFRLNGRILVYFAAWENHIGFYPTPSGTAAFEAELSPYRRGKGSIQFPLDRPVPYDLISRIVTFRVKENLEMKPKRARS
jgi:uncharacterized protein YdhG (YjbR/CyaY superfamily)